MKTQLFTALFVICSASSVLAQSGLGGLGGAAQGALAVTATDGIEWNQKEQVYIARGDAGVQQGNNTIFAQTLRAYYTQPAKSSETGIAPSTQGSIYRIEAIGSVVAELNKDLLNAGRLIYNVQTQLAEATGDEPVYRSADGITIQARDLLRYDPKNLRAEAKGNVRSANGDNRVNADSMVLEFSPNPNGGDGPGPIRQIIAEGNVVIVQDQIFAQSNSALYFPTTEEAKLSGNVIIQQNGNVVRGEYGEFFFKEGVARLLADDPNAIPGLDQNTDPESRRVWGIIIPGQGLSTQ